MNAVTSNEVKVLKALEALGYPATVPQIAKAMHEEFSDAKLYSMLARLSDCRLVVREEEVMEGYGSATMLRITWSVAPA